MLPAHQYFLSVVLCSYLYLHSPYSIQHLMQLFEIICCIDKEVNVLKLTIKPGEYINIGDDVRVIYSGGSEGNIHLLIDAPRELNIVRSKVLARNTANSDKKESRYISPYYAERGLSPETLSKIRRLIREDKKMNKQVIDRKDDISQDNIQG